MHAVGLARLDSPARFGENGFDSMLDEEKIETIARATHETNRAYCVALGDFSQELWEDAPEWQRQSAIEGVRSILEGRATTPEQQHEEWCRFRRADGWTHGDVKDPVAKTHPCLVPYEDLPPEQRGKDHLFRCVTLGLLGRL